MTDVLLMLAGITSMAIPMLYAFGVVCAWALIRNEGTRRVVLWAAAGTALLWTAFVVFELAAGLYRERIFAGYCERYSKPEIYSSISDIDSLLINIKSHEGDKNQAELFGNVAFPFYMAGRLLLSGIDPLSVVAIRTRYGYDVAEIGVDGRVKTTRFQEQPEFRYGYSWQETKQSKSDAIKSLTLVVEDFNSGKVLAKQPVFLLQKRAVNLFPALSWITPMQIRQQSIVSCPKPLGIAVFLRSVVGPKQMIGMERLP